ncbi:OppA family ABC transporter substrate-binding lipoprotein [Metamycoplasma neophronis]|uniref:Lipoprotein n=1 Tax=Metamycoplasma neophronis TaxID=872983 RepID=A0ABY2Z1G6_9BACT|nr:hypothetical protein [Metamycoplasma neophronis]TPR53392.1 hypothetical protein FJR74_02670 [Metamycoplasma neophronis]
MPFKTKKSLLWGITLAAGIPITTLAISCQRVNYNKDKSLYKMHLNIANSFGDFAYLMPNYLDENLQTINLATGAKLFRLETSNQPIIDFRDNIIIKPTLIKYKFEYAKNITIYSKNQSNEIDNLEFNKDSTMRVDFSNPKEKDEYTFYPKPDKGNGFNSPYLFTPSSNKKSINSDQFLKSLKNTNQLVIDINDQKSQWVNAQGKSQNQFVSVNDFRLGLLKSALLNKEFRKSYAQKNNIQYDEKTFEFIDDKTNNFDLIKLLNDYQIDTKALFDFNQDKLIFKTVNDAFIDLSDFFYNFFLQSNYIDALPYQYISQKFNLSQSLNWLKEYGKSFDKMQYASYYYIAKNDNSETVLKLNKQYTPSGKRLNEINILYNNLPLAKSTFGMQMYNAFLQNIVSDLKFNDLSLNEQQDLLKKYNRYNISYNRNVEKYFAHNKIINNYLPLANKHYFNDNFAKLYYGMPENQLNEKANITALNQPKNMRFASLINNVINQYAFIQSNRDIWLSQAPLDIAFSAKNEGENYNSIKDAIIPISQPIILKNETNGLGFYANEYQFKNKEFANQIENVNLLSKLKAYNFEIIKNELKLIIDEFYSQSNSHQDIEFDIPIESNALNLEHLNLINKIPQIFLEISPRLRAKIVLINNVELYQEYFQKNRSIYKENKFSLLRSNTEAFIAKEFSLPTSNLLYLANQIASYNFVGQNPYNEISDLLAYLKSHNINISQKKYQDLNKYIFENQNLIENLVSNYAKDLSLFRQVQLINQINNLTSYTVSLSNVVNSSSFYKVIYQKHIEKPITYDGLNYWQDIKIK